ncbi:MAG: rhodanese-like domain-containing protein [Rhizomicrobium sp.]
MHRRAFTTSLLGLVAAAPALAQSGSAPTIAQSALIQPAALADILKAGNPPPLLQVGFSVMYSEAHIPGSVYAGPTGTEAGIEKLKIAVQGFDKAKPVVIYCGCCPWVRCPNVAGAYKTLTSLGFTQIKVLYIADNFGADWADKGYPVAHG